MSHKIFVRVSVLSLLALLAALIPLQVRAGGVCGGAYTVEIGDTVDKLAAMCGTSPASILAANPGLKEPLAAGQVIIIPGANYGAPTVPPTLVPPPPPPTVIIPPPTVINNYTYNYFNYYTYYRPSNYNGTYVVQPGDTFASIAYSFGMTVQDLWAANPFIPDINMIYPGQTLYIPSYYFSGTSQNTTATSEPTPLSYSVDIPRNAPTGFIRLINKTEGDVYISLRTSRADGSSAVNEFPVKKALNVEIPKGWIDYIAWVGGVKFTGGFQLHEDTYHTITFNKSKVVVD